MPFPVGSGYIIKMGGAAITEKSVYETARPDVLQRTAQQLAQAQAAKPQMPRIVVHGAGSFGHHTASKYKVAQGWVNSELSRSEVQRGWVLTRTSCSKLHGLVVSSLSEEGLQAVGVSPFEAGWRNSGGQVTVPPSGLEAIQACLDNGMTPVLHGDCVMDDQRGCSILSGDTIARYLAEVYRPDRVVFLTNVAGVYDQPPEEEGAQLLQMIHVNEDGKWHAGASDGVKMVCSSDDCTGGMSKKVEEAASIAQMGIDVVIALAGSEDARLALMLESGELRQLMKTSGWKGTLVIRD